MKTLIYKLKTNNNIINKPSLVPELISFLTIKSVLALSPYIEAS